MVGTEIFNANFWAADSKGIIQSCGTEYSVLHHCVGQISAMCSDAERLCRRHIETIQQQWVRAKFDLGKLVIYGQQPDLHIRIEAFFSCVKSLLDLLVQLVSSEKIVSVAIDGFHRTQNVYGGRVINALRGNASRNHKALAAKVAAVISEHKSSWIDRAIGARNHLIHPKEGMHQIMFQLDFVEQKGKLLCAKVRPPDIDSVPIDEYAQHVLDQATRFVSAFLALVREAAVSNSGIEPTR
jgi:hypothetical protein